MADEQQTESTTQTTETQTEAEATGTGEQNTQADTSAGTQNTDQTAEHMIPKSRFDEVNNRLKQLEQERSKAEKERQKQEEAQMAEQNRFKELYEKAQERQNELEANLRAEQVRNWQRDAAAKAQLPAEMADRLRGETYDEIAADAEAFAKALPKPQAPNNNGSEGDGAAPNSGETPVWTQLGLSKEEYAARHNLNPDYLE